MKTAAKIFVAGATGLVGSALVRRLCRDHCNNLLTPTHTELDLADQRAVADFFGSQKPEYVFLAAARAGGILANSSYPAEFIHQNLSIQTHVIHQAYLHGVKRLLFLGSSCIYPRLCSQPIKEEYLLTDSLEPTNEPYAVAKIAGIKMCQAYNHQYGTTFICVMPTNLYGPNDNFDLATSHVIPALLRKFHEAKVQNLPTVTVWGSGRPRREFLHVDDLADACVFLLHQETWSRAVLASSLINIGTGVDLTVGELAELIREIVGYPGRIVFDTSKPDGTPRKLLDVSKMKGLGWEAKIELRAGLREVYDRYLLG